MPGILGVARSSLRTEAFIQLHRLVVLIGVTFFFFQFRRHLPLDYVFQVAEMHGELIEFNERLHRALMAKETLVSHMRQELIDLRGPVSVCLLNGGISFLTPQNCYSC